MTTPEIKPILRVVKTVGEFGAAVGTGEFWRDGGEVGIVTWAMAIETMTKTYASFCTMF